MRVIIPVAGFGTRMLPLTKVVSKEMLPFGPKPLLQWAIDEALMVSDDVVVVAGEHNATTVEYYTSDIQNVTLRMGRSQSLSEDISEGYDGGPFAVILPDMVHLNPCLPAMVARSDDKVVSVMARNDCSPYGTVSGKEWIVTTFQEKPKNYGPGIVLSGRYLFRNFDVMKLPKEFSATCLGAKMHLVGGPVYDCGTLSSYLEAWKDCQKWD